MEGTKVCFFKIQYSALIHVNIEEGEFSASNRSIQEELGRGEPTMAEGSLFSKFKKPYKRRCKDVDP